MKTSLIAASLGLTLLAACEYGPVPGPPLPLAVQRAYADTVQDHPFDDGAISVLAEEHGELHTFTLRPCGQDRICGARRGKVVRAPDYWVVTGAYSGRTFYISPGGDGWIKRSGRYYPLAWH